MPAPGRFPEGVSISKTNAETLQSSPNGKKQQLFTPDWLTGVSEKDEENCQGRL
jgi:hypothetical protein